MWLLCPRSLGEETVWNDLKGGWRICVVGIMGNQGHHVESMLGEGGATGTPARLASHTPAHPGGQCTGEAVHTHFGMAFLMPLGLRAPSSSSTASFP